MSLRILVLPGTTAHGGAAEHALAFEAARRLALAGADLSIVNLADYVLPLLDADEPMPEPPAAALGLAERIAAQDALLLVSPERHDSVPALAKNAVDWTAEAPRLRGHSVRPFAGLVVGLLSASPGRLGDFPALAAWRPVFLALGAGAVLADGVATGSAEESQVLSGEASERLDAFLGRLVEAARTDGRHPP